ncbi:MAG: hypothetical protein ACI89J_003163, partial [Hyphomicrobiaceae bacterium]
FLDINVRFEPIDKSDDVTVTVDRKI